MMKTAALLPLLPLLLVCSCAGPEKENVDPRYVPERISLYRREPVLAVRLNVREGEYKVEAFRTVAQPTPSALASRAVILRTKSAQGALVSSLTIDHPLLLEIAEGDKTILRQLHAATLVVFLPKPDDARVIEVEVAEGPNKGSKWSFPVDPAKLQSFSPTKHKPFSISAD